MTPEIHTVDSLLERLRRDGVRRTIAWFDADASRRRLPAENDAQIEKILAAYAKAWPEGKIA